LDGRGEVVWEYRMSRGMRVDGAESEAQVAAGV
jgi:hypothetical protein